MLKSFTADTFRPLLDDTFSIRFSDGVVELRLVEVAEAPGPPGTPRAPFALTFVGPGNIVLPQRIYGFEHHALGAFPMFIVPLGPADGGMRYEAVFS